METKIIHGLSGYGNSLFTSIKPFIDQTLENSKEEILANLDNVLFKANKTKWFSRQISRL